MLLCVHRDRADYLGRGAQVGHLDFHTAQELFSSVENMVPNLYENHTY